MRLNPDAHWSAAFYRGLNDVQLTDSRNVVNINCDDAAGFRLDSMTTHRLQRTPSVQGKPTLTTRTDFVNRYPSILQTSSYHFAKTGTTFQFCAGVVKATGVFPKNPAQHAADVEMLDKNPLFRPVFFHPDTGERKLIECVRVDGSSDEGPSHLEVQFFWTARHIAKHYFATVVTTRNSGSSFLNKVELQNGCLALGHSNLFIPSTLHGTNFDPCTGKLDREVYTRNMDSGTDVYLSRVDQSPCGGVPIHLFKGADSGKHQELRTYLLRFLKGPMKEREVLKREHPEMYEYFQKVWKIREAHMVRDLPVNYVFFLRCCFKPDCTHPLCVSHNGENPMEVPRWYEGGPLVTYLPIPVADPDHPWGSPNCNKCKGICHGHYLGPREAAEAQTPLSQPPSIVLKAAFDGFRGRKATAVEVETLAKKTLLPSCEVEMWLQHLETVSENRRRGAAKAAETRRRKKTQTSVDTSGTTEVQVSDETYYCGLCHEKYVEVTDEVEHWIQCDQCDSWIHYVCAGLNPDSPPPSKFVCESCSD